jgi:L-amino acid N-acyltransferase YncA
MVYFPSDLTEFFGIRAAMWRMALLDPSRRGKGLGTGFFQSLVAYHGQEGLDIVDSGVSMRNLASLNLHNKCGFKVSSTLLTFHKWLGA